MGVEVGVKYSHDKAFRRDKHFTTPTLDFKFGFTIPTPRNWRIITERNELGRIIKSEVPLMQP